MVALGRICEFDLIGGGAFYGVDSGSFVFHFQHSTAFYFQQHARFQIFQGIRSMYMYVLVPTYGKVCM